MVNVIRLNEQQANDFLRKYLQKNIKVVDFTKDSDDNEYFVTLRSGKLFNKIETNWQYRDYIGSLCFGEYEMKTANKRFDIYNCDKSLLEKANKVVRDYIEKWEKISPI